MMVRVSHIQQSKEDSWKCTCGKYHKGFPYECPDKKKVRRTPDFKPIGKIERKQIPDTTFQDFDMEEIVNKLNKVIEIINKRR